MANSRRVAITGFGVISPGAIGEAAFDELLASGKSAVAEVSRFDVTRYHARTAALVTDFKPKDFIPVMRMRRMNALSRLGVAAAQMAVNDARVKSRGYERGEIGVALGSAFGPVQTSLDYMNEYVDKGPSLAPPQLFAESVANAPGSHIAIEHGFEGFNLTFTQRESSVAAAAMYACSQLLKGSVRATVVAGVDEMNETLFAVLDRAGALSRRRGDVEEGARPFDRTRNGLVAGEGSAAFVLELDPPEGGRHGWISGFAVARDRSASISDWGEDVDAVVRAMKGAIDDAGIAVSDVDAVFASANSSVRGDRVEYRGLQALFGDAVPPVVASKAYFGEYAGGGALQLAAASQAIRLQALPATPGFSRGEDDMRFRATERSEARELRHILLNTISAGGGIVSMVLSRDSE
jgi:3-oxoacyl-[acyl-carrier-protein] synthase II